MLLQVLMTALEQGAILSFAVFGVALAIQIVSFPDLTVDGSFTLGGAVSAVLLTLLPDHVNRFAVPLVAFLAGAAAGSLTGVIHAFLRLNKLISGILVMAILYSFNLRLMGRANISLYGIRTIFSDIDAFSTTITSRWPMVLVSLALSGIVLLLFARLLLTRFGLFLRATGQSRELVAGLGVDPRVMVISGIAVANGSVAFAGSLYAQRYGSADIMMGSGVIIWALAAIVIGQVFVRPPRTGRIVASCLLGSFLYQAIIATGLRLGLPASDLKAITAILVLVILAGWSRKFGAAIEHELKIS